MLKPLPANAAKGVIAQIAKCDGIEYLRLVNSTDYPIKGTIATDTAFVRDLAYDDELTGAGKYKLSMKPDDIRIIKLKYTSYKFFESVGEYTKNAGLDLSVLKIGVNVDLLLESKFQGACEFCRAFEAQFQSVVQS